MMLYFVKNNMIHHYPVPLRCGVQRDREPIFDNIPEEVSACRNCMRTDRKTEFAGN